MFSEHCSLFRVCSGCVQSMFRVCSEYVQSMFRACSEYVQSMLRVCSEYIQIMFRVSLITGNPPNWFSTLFGGIGALDDDALKKVRLHASSLMSHQCLHLSIGPIQAYRCTGQIGRDFLMQCEHHLCLDSTIDRWSCLLFTALLL